MTTRNFIHTAAMLLLFALLYSSQLFAQQPSPSTLTVERIFASREFAAERFGPARWLEGGAAYTTIEASATSKGADDLIRYDSASGQRSVLIAAEQLIPSGQTAPLNIEDYDWSADGKRVLIFTNTVKVWRYNTRGDYWVLDRATKSLTKLGGDGAASTLMFAKFSPDGTRVGYVRDNTLFVETLSDHKITQLSDKGSRTHINGTFDWVYEEELDCRDGWRWSPDGKRIAYWQLDATGVRDFFLINNTDSSMLTAAKRNGWRFPATRAINIWRGWNGCPALNPSSSNG
jgi:dipeptidyl-peptidase 4